MALYCFICKDCGEEFEEFFKMNGKKEPICPKCKSIKTNRDFRKELNGIGVIADDWGPGYNYGISERYENKTDLMNKIRAKGFEPSLNDNGLKPVKRELYGEDRRMQENKKKQDAYPQVIIEV